MSAVTGRCLCGACTFELSGAHNFIGHCHCDSCRRATASPMTTFIGHPDGAWRWTGAAPRMYESSPGNTRGFCGNCGSPMMFAATRFPSETHFYAALLSDPTTVEPEAQYHADERLPWMPAMDALPEE